MIELKLDKSIQDTDCIAFLNHETGQWVGGELRESTTITEIVHDIIAAWNHITYYLEKEKMIELKYRTELQNGFIKLEYVDCLLGDQEIPIFIERNMTHEELVKRINYAVRTMQERGIKSVATSINTEESVTQELIDDFKASELEPQKQTQEESKNDELDSESNQETRKPEEVPGSESGREDSGEEA